jgi:hypothetical protein
LFEVKPVLKLWQIHNQIEACQKAIIICSWMLKPDYLTQEKRLHGKGGSREAVKVLCGLIFTSKLDLSFFSVKPMSPQNTVYRTLY